MGAAADRLELVAGLDPERDGAALDVENLGGGGDAQADRGRRGMADIELYAEALMAGGKQVFNRRERCSLEQLIITGVARTAIRPEPTNGAVCSGPTTISAVPARPGVTRARTELTRAGLSCLPYSVNSRHFDP